MIALALCSFLIGSVLGTRFRFLILLPIIAVGSTTLAVISTVQGGTNRANIDTGAYATGNLTLLSIQGSSLLAV